METKELFGYAILGMLFFISVVIFLVVYAQKKYGDDEIEEKEEQRDYLKYRHYYED